MELLYDNYKVGRDYDGGPEYLSYEEFIKDQKNHFVWQDKAGDWKIYISEDYAPMAECGKPVIYLYPTEKTDVKIEVGAEITKSEPEYKSGWDGTAYPDGKIVVENNTYPYLFWEGEGNGTYPFMKDYGVVVKNNDAVMTIKSHLLKMGLNEQEVEDFIEFWEDKLPNDPYIRLTWFGTKQMDELAPVKIEPKPDTRIRVFLV